MDEFEDPPQPVEDSDSEVDVGGEEPTWAERMKEERSKKQWKTPEERHEWVKNLRREICVRKDHFPETAAMIGEDGTLNRE